jgi:hypothetical protein
MSSNRLNEPELEQALLGGLLLDPSHLDQLVDFGPVIFTTPANRAVAAAILTTWRESRAVDAETVAEALQRSGEYQLVGGHQAIIELLEKYPHAGHVARHFEILLQLHHRRAAREVLLDRAAAVSDRSQTWEAVAEAIEAPVGRRIGHPEIESAGKVVAAYPNNRPVVVAGLLRQGETATVVAASKQGKSWLVTQLGLAIASGGDWLGRQCARGKVLVIDGELHREVAAFRWRSSVKALNLNPSILDQVDLLPLRGKGVDMLALARWATRWQGYRAVIVDPLYRIFGPDTDENSNADLTAVYNAVDEAAAASGAAWVLVHHASKGMQFAKAVAEVGAGAGAIARAADCHVAIRPHKVPGVAAFEAVVRSFPPVEPQCIAFRWPLWEVASEDLDPSDLLGAKPSPGAQVVAARQDLADDADAIERFLDSQPGPVHLSKIVAGVCLAGRQIHDKRAKAGIERLILEDRVSSRLIPAGANGRRVPGFWTCEKFAKADEDDKQKQTDGGLFPVVSGCSSPAQADEDEQTETAPLGGGSVCLSVRCAAEDCSHTEGNAKRKRTRRKSKPTRPRNRLGADSESDFEPWPSETEARDIARPKKRPKSKRTSQAKPPVWSVANQGPRSPVE